MKLTKKELNVISEIARRIKEFKNGNKNANMIYLGYPSEVKTLVNKGLIVPYSKETPKVLNWYNLTEEGKKLV